MIAHANAHFRASMYAKNTVITLRGPLPSPEGGVVRSERGECKIVRLRGARVRGYSKGYRARAGALSSPPPSPPSINYFICHLASIIFTTTEARRDGNRMRARSRQNRKFGPNVRTSERDG